MKHEGGFYIANQNLYKEPGIYVSEKIQKMYYTVKLKYGPSFLSTTVEADSIGEAVLRATQKIADETVIPLHALIYYQCVPVK